MYACSGAGHVGARVPACVVRAAQPLRHACRRHPALEHRHRHDAHLLLPRDHRDAQRRVQHGRAARVCGVCVATCVAPWPQAPVQVRPGLKAFPCPSRGSGAKATLETNHVLCLCFAGFMPSQITTRPTRRCRAQLPCWSRRAGLAIKPFRIFCTVSVLATGHRQPGAAGCGWPQSCKGTGRSWLQGPVAPCPLSTMPLQLLLVHSACVACDAVAGTHRDVSTCGRASGRALLDRIAAACGMRLRLVAAASTYLRTRLLVVTLLQAWTCACLTPHLGQDHEKIGFGRLRPRSQQISCVLVATFHCLWPQC